MESNFKTKVVSGMIWRFMERITAQAVTFIVSIILARLLEPEHYGVISLTVVFISFANVFVSDGFGKALIQKKDVDELDFSSIFYVNLFFSIVVYVCIFFMAPVISRFYDSKTLTWTLRVLALRLPLAAINSIQHAYVSRQLLFKLFFKATLWGTIVSAVVGILLAYRGFGVWALVAQYLTNTFIDTVVLWFVVKWRPKFVFCIKRVKPILKLSLNIFLTAMINNFYNNLRSLIIGRKYTTADLAYYTKGIQYPNLVITNINTTISSVLYPSFSKLQDDIGRMKSALRKAIRISTFVFFPILMGIFAIAPEIVEIMLTEKWLPCVPYLRIACIYYAMYPINTINLQAIMALGEGQVYFRLSIIKKVFGMFLIIVCMPFGVLFVAFSEIPSAIFAVFNNCRANKKLLKYSIGELLADSGKNAIMSIGMCIAVMALAKAIKLYFSSLLMRLCLEVMFGICIYSVSAVLIRSREYDFIKQHILTYIRK